MHNLMALAELQGIFADAAATGEWLFNLDTRVLGITQSTCQILVTLGDGSMNTALISVK